MGERLTIFVYKDGNEASFKELFDEALVRQHAKAYWNVKNSEFGSECRMAHNGSIHTAFYATDFGGAANFYEHLSQKLNLPWAKLDILEGSIWQAQFFDGASLIDQFSVSPGYWDGKDTDLKEVEEWKGSPGSVSELWGIPVAAINRYMTDWQYTKIDEDTFEFVRKGKAYPTDKYEYGDFWQMFDFLSALGGVDPTNLRKGAKQHRIEIPVQDDQFRTI